MPLATSSTPVQGVHLLAVPSARQARGDHDGHALAAVCGGHLRGPALSRCEAWLTLLTCVHVCRVCINWLFQPRGRPGETMTDMPFPLYAAGIYEGLAKYAPIGVPLYITETGIPDSKEDRREEMFTTYFPQATPRS